jgi:hypothetical protein
VIVNSPMMYVWFYHGANTWPERHVMHRKSGWRSLAQNEQTYLDKILELYKPLRVAEPL